MVSAILAFVFTFPQQASDNAFLDYLVRGKSGTVTIAYGALLGTVVILWILLWIIENNDRSTAEELISWDHQRAALARLVDSSAFSRSDLRAEIASIAPDRHHPLTRLLGRDWRKDLDDAVELAVARFLERGWIRRVEGPSFDDWFERSDSTP